MSSTTRNIGKYYYMLGLIHHNVNITCYMSATEKCCKIDQQSSVALCCIVLHAGDLYWSQHPQL